MAGTADMLETALGTRNFTVLRAVAGHREPVSGRAIASELVISPTTATTRLRRLEAAEFVRSTPSGRSLLWRLNTDNEVIRAWLREQREPHDDVVDAGASPVSTGGGGVTFERKVAADFLARLLLGHGAPGLGSGRVVVSVGFQQAPEYTVDDLLIEAVAEDDDQPPLTFAVAARRTPDVVDSNEKTQALFRAYVKQLLDMPVGVELRLGLAVAGPQDHAQQLAGLAALAAAQVDAAAFFVLVRTPKKFDEKIRSRLGQVEKLVRRAVTDLGLVDPPAGIVEQQTWALLSRLQVLMPRVESSDDPDWSALANSLIPASRGQDLYGATLLRDRLLTLADDWAPAAAVVNSSMLRRAVHDLLDSAKRRHARGWQALDVLGRQARMAVANQIVSPDGVRRVSVDRTELGADLARAIASARGVVLHGESGVGKSALALGLLNNTGAPGEGAAGKADAGAFAERAARDDETQFVCLNLRHLPRTTLEFERGLHAPLQELLSDMSAPTRVLVVDGADAVAEGAQDLLAYVVTAAVSAQVKVVAVTASDARQLAADALAACLGEHAVEVKVPPLSDPEVEDVLTVFQELLPMAANARSRELLRRPVVVDLLVRGGVQETPLSDVDAMEQIWSGLVRRHGASDRGTPDARDLAMRLLARQALDGSDEMDVAASIDPEALAGLRKDGLLRTSEDNPFRAVPEFAHDEIRRYAVARVLLAAGDPTKRLKDAGVPRWALGAARLACQAVLVAPDSPSNPMLGRFAQWQNRFSDLVTAGHGERWMDVPGEALLTLGDPRPLLREGWADLQSADHAGLHRLARLVDQRLRGEYSLVRVAAVEPLVELLLQDETPWRISDQARTLLVEWLRALVGARVPTGHPLREQLRSRLVNFTAAADERLRVREEARIAAEAAITDEERAARRAARKSFPIFGQEIGYPRSRERRQRPSISSEITKEAVVELFALLGPDLSADGEAILRRIAEADPDDLAPAVENLLCGQALASYGNGFLADMVLAYYLDDEDDGNRGYGHDDGVRDHHGLSFGLPLAASFRGPFLSLFRGDLRRGASTLNRILNHAATVRAEVLEGHDRRLGEDTLLGSDNYKTELSLTGSPRLFVGDSGTWNWYRGTGVGPYPCMSALQALERVCDEYIDAGVPLDVLVDILLTDCENVAMVGLLVGILVRHLEKVGSLLDPFLAEHAVWHFEFARVAQEYSGLRASSEGLTGADRRNWSLREAAAWLVLKQPDREDELRLVGQRLVEKAQRNLENLGASVPKSAVETELATVRSWASGLDKSTYSLRETDDGYVVESRPPAEVSAILSAGMNGFMRYAESTRLIVRYHIDQEKGDAKAIAVGDMITDLNSAVSLLEDGSATGDLRVDGWDAAAAVAAHALTQHLINGKTLPRDSLSIAADILLRVGEGHAPRVDRDIDTSYFSQGADRSAARLLPLLLTPAASLVRQAVDGGDGSTAYQRVEKALAKIVRTNVLEARLFLARGLDSVWNIECTGDHGCVHHIGLGLAIDTMRDCVFGEWDNERQRQSIDTLADPIIDTLPTVADPNIYVARLDAAIRALGAAGAANICVSPDARAVLDVLLDAQRRGLLAHDRTVDARGTHSLVAARALLTLGDEPRLMAHVDAYVDHATVLDQFLRALGAAAEEEQRRADAARRLWPQVVDRILNAAKAGHTPFDRASHGRDYTLAALLPNPAGETTYLHSEFQNTPIVWWTPIDWASLIERWLDLADGKAACIDRLIVFLESASSTVEQVRLGVPWVRRAVLSNPQAAARQCYSLTRWLIDIRMVAEAVGASNDWQRTVDALVVAGEGRLAPYSE